jgi:hypothetical protein
MGVRRSIVLLLTAVAAAATLVSAALAAAPDTKQMVLTLRDLPAGFKVDKAYYADNKRAAKESENQTLAQYTAWGRINGYDREFSRDVGTGILFVSADASTYATVGGVTRSVNDAYTIEGKVHRFEGKPVTFVRVPTARVGDDARMFKATMKSNGYTFDAYGVIWRYRTVAASVLALGLHGTVKPAQVAALARAEQAHIAAALG